MLCEIEVGALCNAFKFSPTPREQELNVTCTCRVVTQLIIVVWTNSQHLARNTKIDVPIKASLTPVLVPLRTVSWRNEKFHFHLFKLTRTENEVAWCDFVTEALAYLSDTKWWTLTAGLQHIGEVDKHSLSSFRTHVHIRTRTFDRASGCFEHQVEGARFCELTTLLTLGTITFFDVVFTEASIAHGAVDQGVGEICKVTRGFEHLWWSENGCIDQNSVIALLHHRANPGFLYIAQHQ